MAEDEKRSVVEGGESLGGKSLGGETQRSGSGAEPKDGKDLTAREKAAVVARAADDKRALDIVTLDLQGITLVADFFVICSGRSDVHIRSIADGIEEALKKEYRIRPAAVQGRIEANWIILDYGDVVVHVFSELEREYYDLESFWKQARVVERIMEGRPQESSRESSPGGSSVDSPPASGAEEAA